MTCPTHRQPSRAQFSPKDEIEPVTVLCDRWVMMTPGADICRYMSAPGVMTHPGSCSLQLLCKLHSPSGLSLRSPLAVWLVGLPMDLHISILLSKSLNLPV